MEKTLELLEEYVNGKISEEEFSMQLDNFASEVKENSLAI